MLSIILSVAILIGLCVAFWLFVHRDPERSIQPFEGYLSPADGIVVGIHDAKPKTKIPKGLHGITALLDDFPQGRHVVVIMMKPHHVHVQRAPAAGTVTALTHKPGTFKNAVFGDWRQATLENEHAAFLLEGKYPCKVYLIAGLLARRIVPIAKQGQDVVQGERIGRIDFGSQVALVLPEAQILVKEGQSVQAGLTQVAR